MNTWGLLAIGAFALALTSKKTSNLTSTTGAQTADEVAKAIRTDTFVGPTIAGQILTANNAAASLAIGNAALQGVDLTNPASVAIYQAPVTSGALDSWQAVNVVQTAPSYTNSSNPFLDNGGAFPRMQGGVWVTDPNMDQRLAIAWDNSQAGFNH